MTVRPALPADAAWMASDWTDSANAIGGVFGGKKIKVAFTADDLARDIASKGQRIYVEPTAGKRGFFICHQGMLPEHPSLSAAEPAGGLAAQLVIWVTQTGMAKGSYRTLLTDLMRFWLQDEIARGEFEYSFGLMPEEMAVNTAGWLDDWVKLGGVERVILDQQGVRWHRYWCRTADGVLKLPAAVAVSP